MVLFCTIKIIGACKPCRFFKIYCNHTIFAMYQDEGAGCRTLVRPGMETKIEIYLHSTVTQKISLRIRNPEDNVERLIFKISHFDCNLTFP